MLHPDPDRCGRQNRPLHEALCVWIDDPAMAAELVSPPSDTTNADGLRFAMHEVLVLERFALEARKSRKFRIYGMWSQTYGEPLPH